MSEAPNMILVVLFEGGPVFQSADRALVRDFLADVLEEHGDLYQVFDVFDDTTPSSDVTEDFARAWADDTDFGGGDEPEEFLVNFHGFVLAYLRDELVGEYRRALDDAADTKFERSKLRTL